MGPSRELGGQRASRALGMRTWCTCPDVARDGPERGPDGTWAPGSSSPLCQALLHMFLYRRTEWIRAGPPGQRRSAPVLSLVPLCPQSFFRQVVFTSRSDFKDPLCFRRYRKQARLGGAPPPQPRPVCGWMGHSRLVGEGGASPPRRDVECPHSPNKKGRSRCTARRDSASVPASQAVPAADRWRVRPRLDASAGVALRRRGL